jgi:sugar O-acyltransferase (sialic acid O-acetyltransferase NeuD family)
MIIQADPSIVDCRPVFLVGAGGLAREMYSWISAELDETAAFRFSGFVVDDPGNESDTGNVRSLGPILTVAEASHVPGASFIMAVGAPQLRLNFFERLVMHGMAPLSFIHSSAIIGRSVDIGIGTTVCPHVCLTANVRVGRGVLLNVGARLGHDVTVGDFSSLLGSNVVNGSVKIGERALLGAGCVIHPGVTVGNDSTVGIGAVVISRVRHSTTVFGNPAKRIIA